MPTWRCEARLTQSFEHPLSGVILYDAWASFVQTHPGFTDGIREKVRFVTGADN